MGVALVAGLSIAALGLSAAPAFAADGRTLPAGYSLFAVTCDNEQNENQLYSINTVTAQATPIGAGTATTQGGACAGPGAWNAANNTAYYLDWNDDGFLRSVDLTTGVSTEIAPTTLNGANVYPDSLAIGLDGASYAIMDGGGFTTTDSALYSISLTTGELTFIAETGVLDASYYGFSVDPTSGLFYVVDTEGAIASIAVSTGVQTPLGTVDFDGDNSTWTLSIDFNGIMWIENDSFNSDLWSVDPDDIGGADSFSGLIALDPADAEATSFYTESVFVAPTPGYVAPVTPAALPAVDPRLAETGVDDAQTGMMLGFGALTLLLGAALITGRTRKSHA